MAKPYPQGVAPDYPRALSGGLLREIAAALLILLGVGGLVVVAFAYDWRIGVGALSAAALGAGVFLGYER